MSTLGYLAASVSPRLAMAGSAVAIPILAVQELSDVGLGGAGFRARAFAAGAVLAGSVTGLGGGLAVAGIGLIWVVSGALMAGYPAPGREGAR